MSSLTFIVLAHESAAHVSHLLDTLLSADETIDVVVHHDAKVAASEHETLRTTWSADKRVHFVEDRTACRWGEFGLVDGVVRSLRLIRTAGLPGDHVYLVSGSCMPVRPLAELRWFLDRHPDMEFIECHTADWMIGGLRAERYQYRHWFNFQTHRRLFNVSWKIQRLLKMKRRMPGGLEARFGSQWWCLTRKTCDAVLEWIDSNPDGYRFFATTWIPDELFFQSLVWHIKGGERIHKRTLTYFNFNAFGRPDSFYDDSTDAELPTFPFFFVRKVAYGAKALRQRLRERAAAPLDPRVVTGHEHDLPDPIHGEPLSKPQKRLEAEQHAITAGKIFDREQIFRYWPSSMSRWNKPFVVLYGPQICLDSISSVFKADPGMTLLGHVFDRGRVDFGNGHWNYGGLSSKDVAIRDRDPPLYLSRILSRTAGIPVLQIMPGAFPLVDAGLLRVPGCVLVMVQPAGLRSRDARRVEIDREFFWSLAVSDRKRTVKDRKFFEAPTRPLTRLQVEAEIVATTRKSVPGWLSDDVFGHARGKGPQLHCALAPLLWGPDPVPTAAGEYGSDEDMAMTLTRLFGADAPHMFDLLCKSRKALDQVSVIDAVNGLPRHWGDYFRPFYDRRDVGEAI